MTSLDISHLTNNWIDSITGAVLTVLFYWFRFNSLRGTRSYTRAALYYSGLLCFIFPFLTLYITTLFFFSPAEGMLLLVLVWPLPWLPRWWRDLCHGMADIPAYAYTLKEMLANAPFDIRESDAAAVQRKLARFGFAADDFGAMQASVIQGRFLKMAAVMHHLEKWEQEYHTFMNRNSEIYRSLSSGFDLLAFKIVRAVKCVSKVNSTIMRENFQVGSKVDEWHGLGATTTPKSEPFARLQSAAQAITGTMMEDLRKDIDFFLDVLLLFVARGVLANEWTFANRRQKLEAIGFTMVQPPTSIVPSVISSAMVVVTCSALWFAVVGFPGTGVVAGKMVVTSIVNVVLNFALVFHLKRRFAFANADMFGKMPIAFIATVGLTTSMVEILIRGLFEYFELQGAHHGSIASFLMLSLESLSWSLFPWGTGAVTAFLAQDTVWGAISMRWKKRVLDGVVYGGSWVAMMLICWALYRLGVPFRGMERVPLGLGVLFSAGLGFLLGYLAIAKIREGSSLKEPVFRVSSLGSPLYAR